MSDTAPIDWMLLFDGEILPEDDSFHNDEKDVSTFASENPFSCEVAPSPSEETKSCETTVYNGNTTNLYNQDNINNTDTSLELTTPVHKRNVCEDNEDAEKHEKKRVRNCVHAENFRTKQRNMINDLRSDVEKKDLEIKDNESTIKDLQESLKYEQGVVRELTAKCTRF